MLQAPHHRGLQRTSQPAPQKHGYQPPRWCLVTWDISEMEQVSLAGGRSSSDGSGARHWSFDTRFRPWTIIPMNHCFEACFVTCRGRWIAYRPIVCRNGPCLYVSSNRNQSICTSLLDTSGGYTQWAQKLCRLCWNAWSKWEKCRKCWNGL